MRYASFRIKNFKGIKDTRIKLNSELDRSGVFAFVGLNESGKTTILEAIHSFSPDKATSELVGGEDKSGVPIQDRVPRHLISSFTGDVSVQGELVLEDSDVTTLCNSLEKNEGIKIDVGNFPRVILIEKINRFENGDFVGNYVNHSPLIKIKTGKQRKWRAPNADERKTLRSEIMELTPAIAYFPTFVFDFPKRIFLTSHLDGKIGRFYRGVFQDILDYDGQGLTIEESITKRVQAEQFTVPWTDFLLEWSASDEKGKVQHVVDRAGATVTKVVFGRWNEIFGEDIQGKEIQITPDVKQGFGLDENGNTVKTDTHSLYIKFQIKDGTRRFDVKDRSLGFRWFFAFMLFTQFRVARENSRPVLFLFDEPASNLHAAAQQKLIDSFPEIARDGNTLAYTTHSHYLIEPKWLEQTFIVTNRADTPSSSVIDDLSLDDDSLDIQATKYRIFANQHPNQVSYFQPILDRLQVVPSRFDWNKPAVVVEGKSDYYILRYAAELLNLSELPLIPGLGAGTFDALVSMDAGWNLRLVFLLDGDKEGDVQKSRYRKEYALTDEKLVTLKELVAVDEIEDLLDDTAKEVISSALDLGRRPSKKQISTFFQENLASKKVVELSPSFSSQAKLLLDKLKEHLDSLQGEG